MKIGLISDTHGFLDPGVFAYFEACDEIWHAGDIGDIAVAQALENFKPLRAVYGNIDDRVLQQRYPEDLAFRCENVFVLMTHIGGIPPRYNPRVLRLFKTHTPQLFICGHSHILRVKRDPDHGNLLYINPGAAGNHGFHAMKTIIRFEIAGSEIKNMEAIELGKRGALPK
ncbi:MAG TPA: metallophosphoesterase family protein [Ohtaekwangia sp.]|nr:metallophosphoesterase family protein [Ohtaekwangia sp.]